MTEPFLIAHKVRGEAAFDVAEKFECPSCKGRGELPTGQIMPECPSCGGTGFWWIVSTSGHRAYPYWDISFSEMETCQSGCVFVTLPDEMPEGLRDHYQSGLVVAVKPQPKVTEINLKDLGLL